MSESNGFEVVAEEPDLSPKRTGLHQLRIVEAIPTLIKNAPPSRLRSLLRANTSTKTIPAWYLRTSEGQRHYLKQLIDERWRLQSKVEGPLKDLQQDIGAFAKPLFSMLIRSNFNTDEDISQLTVKLYVADRLIFGIDTGATRLRESTLLDAALHNFESAETVEGYFSSGTGVYRKNFRNELTLIPGMTLKKIATLCRQIDIGQQYQTHIKNILVPADSSVRASLEQDSIASEKAAFKLESLVAYLKSDLGSYAYGKLQQVHDGLSNIVFHDRPLHRHRLSLMGFRLHGIVLFSALSDPSRIKQAIDELMPDGLKQWLEWSQRIPVVSDNAYEKFKLLQVFFCQRPPWSQ